MSLKDFLEQIMIKVDKAGGVYLAVQICQDLLIYCKERRGYLSELSGAAILRDPIIELVKKLEEDLSMDASNGKKILQMMKRYYDEGSLKYLNDRQKEDFFFAYASIISLDRRFGDKWIDQLVTVHGTERFEVGKNQVLPVALKQDEKQVRERYGPEIRLAPLPSTLSGIPLEPEGIVLLETNEFKVCVDASIRPHLEYRPINSTGKVDSVEKSTDNFNYWRVATGLLNLWEEIAWETRDYNGHQVLINVSPKNANGENCQCGHGRSSYDVQKHRFLQLISQCREKEVDILVLPELSFDSALQDELVELTRTPAKEDSFPNVMVLGSAHRTPDDNAEGQTNTLKMVVRRGIAPSIVVEHKKFNPLVDFKDSEKKIYHEHLEPRERCLTLVAGRYISIVPVICKDLLDPQIDQVLKSMKPTFILVPALSPISGPFEDQAKYLARSRTTVVVADNGLDLTSVSLEASTPKKKYYSIFGVFGQGETGSAGCVFEEEFPKKPILPVLFSLEWKSLKVVASHPSGDNEP